MNNLPDHIHHFSWYTKISLELPIGFEEDEEDEQNNTAIYADDLDEDDETGGRVLAKATAVPEGQDDAYLLLAQASAGIDGRGLESREEIVVDGVSAVRQVLRYHQEDAQVDVVRHETFAQIGNVVFSIIGLAPADRGDEYLSAFDHASGTARFVLL